jgi:hypothetical protein
VAGLLLACTAGDKGRSAGRASPRVETTRNPTQSSASRAMASSMPALSSHATNPAQPGNLMVTVSFTGDTLFHLD